MFLSTIRRPVFGLIAALAVSGFGSAPADASGVSATPEEAVQKVRTAVSLLSRDGALGLDVIRDPNSEFRWKDSYVFVVDCDADRVMANAAFPERVGGDIKQHTDYAGYRYGTALCETASQPGGGWIEYVWLKPGLDTPQRKVSFVVTVPGHPFQVGAGVYDDAVSLTALERLSLPGN